MAGYGPPAAFDVPRYSGVKTFARCPHLTDMAGVDVAVLGVPFDTATSFRPGARFGPEAIRSASTLIRPYHLPLGVDVFAQQSVVDAGDVAVTPGNAEKTAGQIASGVAAVLEAGVTPIALGGDHSVVLGLLRAQAQVHGPVGVVLLDAHADTWDLYYGTERYFHGTPFRRAIEEGLIAPERSIFAGMRGPIFEPADLDYPRDVGIEVIPDAELRALGPEAYGRRVRERVGEGPTYFSFDIDVVDPAFAPGTGVPEVGGLSSQEALAHVRALAGIRFTGFDIVEVAPIYDGPGQITAALAANVAWEFLALRAVAGAAG